ncbi:MAG TPA: alpha/beta fold hydrolase [Planctomycetota bacterium]|nr:alpha/beta fold hydrolase [Planctomycetota bacterium]
MADPAAVTFRWRRMALIIVAMLGLFALALFLVQEQLIYFPRRYEAHEIDAPPGGLRALRYRVGDGERVAFVRAPADPEAARWWLVCSGNGGVALDWVEFVAIEDDPSVGYLLVDHPGFGANGGRPSPSAGDATVDGAIAALAAETGLAPAELLARGGVLGHSLGAAVALRAATRHRVGTAVLLAPFTDMMAMARRQVGWPFCHVLTHRYDNRAALRALAEQPRRPSVRIVHGEDDTIVPPAMARDLAAEFPFAVVTALPDVGHNDLIDHAAAIRAAMRGP